MDFMSSKNMHIAATRLPSAGRFFMALSTTELFGVITNASAGGLTMDIGLIKNASTALDGDYNKKIQFMMTSGTNSSALEHSVPEQLFSTPDNPAQGISAVKALQIANEQGIPIYTINQTNINTVLPQLQIDAQAKNDIINAVNAGKVVTVSKTNINFNGWIGCGYIIVNPQTGAGAYMISGGMNGGWMLLAILSFGFLFLSILAFLTGPLGLGLMGLFIAAITTEVLGIAYIKSISKTLDLEAAGVISEESADAAIAAKSLLELGKNAVGFLYPGDTVMFLYRLVVTQLTSIFIKDI